MNFTQDDLIAKADMPDEEFRKIGYKLIDWIIEYRTTLRNYPVVPDVQPGDVINSLPEFPPDKGESFDKIFIDFREKIVPAVTHWNHPGFFAYFNSTSSAPGIFAELLCAAMNVNGMLWKTGPVVTELETVTLKWLRQMLGLEDSFWGIIYDTASTSSLHAIAAAREYQSGLMIREKGMPGRNDLRSLRLYCSEEAHSSIDKAVITLGLGLEGIRKIATDSSLRMKPSDLKKAIEEDKNSGIVPFCVVATIGTTSATSIDPVEDIAAICNKEDIWLHVDAAHAGSAAILPEMRWIMNGVDKADSLVINPHKWMFTPVDLSAFYTRKPEVLKRAFSLVPEYLKTQTGKAENLMDYGMQLGRRFRALKLWFIIRYFGADGIAEKIREHFRLAKIFKEMIESDYRFELMAPVPFTTICFRFNPFKSEDEEQLAELNNTLLNEINASGKIFISNTRLKSKFILRFSVSGLFTGEEDVKNAFGVIREKANELLR